MYPPNLQWYLDCLQDKQIAPVIIACTAVVIVVVLALCVLGILERYWRKQVRQLIQETNSCKADAQDSSRPPA